MERRTVRLTGFRTSSEGESGDIHRQLIGADPAVIAAECIDHAGRSGRVKGVTLAMIVDPDMQQSMVGSPDLLRQLLLSLLEAAVRSMTKGTVELRLSSSTSGPALRLEIIFSGLNKVAKQHRRLFLPTRTSGTSDREVSGFNLALATRLVRSMGGRFGRQANASGGVLFWAEVPLSRKFMDPSPKSRPIFDTPTKRQHKTDALSILVVDDEAMQRDFLESVLVGAGHKVICVCSGKEAITAIANGNFSAVLMDIRMPQMDGVEATRLIRSFESNRSLPILAVTAQDDQEYIRRCYTAGMDGHLAKPINPDILATTIVHAIAAKRAQKGGREWQGSLESFQPFPEHYVVR